MHEHALLKNMLAKVEDIAVEYKAPRIRSLTVKLGALSHLDEEHFLHHFELASKGTVAEGAAVKVECDEDIHAPFAHDVVLQSVEVDRDD